MNAIALDIGTIGAIGCIVLGAIVTANLNWSLWKWLMGQDDRSQ